MSRPVSGRAAKLPGRQAFALRSVGFASDVAGTVVAFIEQEG